MARAFEWRTPALLVYCLVVAGLFYRPITDYVAYAAASHLHSHALLVPLVSAYLVYQRRSALPSPGPSSALGAFLFAGAGAVALSAGIFWRSGLSHNDYLALMVSAFLCFTASGGFLFLGSAWMAAAAFPASFLVFTIPLPDGLVTVLERASAAASAEAAAWFFTAAGTAFVRNDTVFELPGIVLKVAQECSGIRSSWVLFITSTIAAHLFLESPWRRIVFVAFVIPLGILRNGFRILTIGLLCVHVGPHMIDSPIHHRGGPVFFALSLVPFFLALWWLARSERRAARTSSAS